MPARYKTIQHRRALGKALRAEGARQDAEALRREGRVLESPLVYAEGLLPTVEGCVHGVVSRSPLRFQCDRCGLVEGAPEVAAVVAAGRIGFDFPPIGDPRRLCAVCREARWVA